MILQKNHGRKYRSPKIFLPIIITLILVLTVQEKIYGQLYFRTHTKTIKSESMVSSSHFEADHLQLPKLDNAKLKSKYNKQVNPGPEKFAEAFKVLQDVNTMGSWEDSEDGKYSVWRLVVTSPGAENLNIGFGKYDMPEGGELNLYSLINDDHLGPFTSADNDAHGELWTPVIFSDQILIEAIIPKNKVDELKLEIESINHGFLKFGVDDSAEKSGSCNVDVVCPAGDDWRAQISSVGAYTVAGVDTCSGALVNNTAQDGTPYFLTANHCGISVSEASQVVVYWNYQNSTCRTPGSGASGGPGDGPLNQFNSGSIRRATYSNSDFTLLELDDPVNPDFNVAYSGWSREGVNVNSSVAIHHPGVEEKRISFENDPTAITTYLSDTPVVNGTHVRVDDWDIGTTEGGSSGSPLYDPNKRIIGQLHGGFAACGNDDADWYGRIAVSWEGGGTASSRLRDWLDPINSGAMTLDVLSSIAVSSEFELTQVNGDGDNDVEPGETHSAQYTITNSSDSPFQNVIATVDVDNPDVTLTNSVQNLGTIGVTKTDAGKGAGTMLPMPVLIDLENDLVCGESIQITLTLSGTLNGESEVFTNVQTIEIPDDCDFLPEISIVSTSLSDTAGNANQNGLLEPGESPIKLTVNVENTGKPTNEFTVSITNAGSSLIPIDDVVVGAFEPDGTGSVELSFGISATANCDFNETLEFMVVAEGRTVSSEVEVFKGINQNIVLSQFPGIIYGDRNQGQPEVINIDFPISSMETVDDVRVKLNISHTYVNDNIFRLRSPQGSQITLASSVGDDGDNFIDTVFDDSASLSINFAAPPFTGRFRPLQPLSTFDGENINGTWTVIIDDSVSLDSGLINEVTLEIDAPETGSCASPLNVAWGANVNGASIVSSAGEIIIPNPGNDDEVVFNIDVTNSGNSDLYLFDFELGADVSSDVTNVTSYAIGAQQSDSIGFTVTNAKQASPRSVSFKTNDPNNSEIMFDFVIDSNASQINDIWIFE